MELKLPQHDEKWQMFMDLLIVPYGIETSTQNSNDEKVRLLIVPYGIETLRLRCQSKCMTFF